MQFRGSLRLVVLSIFALVCAGAALANERVERTLAHEELLPAGTRLTFENLVGSVKVLPGRAGTPLRVEARVIAEASGREQVDALAGAFALTRSEGDGGILIHVTYPVKRHSAFRLPRSEKDGLISKWVTPLVRKTKVSVDYDDRMVEVGGSKGAAAVAVYVEVTLPLDLNASIRQTVGTIQCRGLRTDLDLRIVEGEIIAEQIFGNLRARTGGGALRIWKHRGEILDLQTGSGVIEVSEVDAQQFNLLTGSGTVEGGEIRAGSLRLESDSGNLHLYDIEPGSFEVVTVSGDVDLGMPLAKTRNGSIESESGDVTLRVGKLAPFDLLARTSDGELKTQELELELLAQDESGTRYRRLNGGIDLRVIAGGKGKIVLRPF